MEIYACIFKFRSFKMVEIQFRDFYEFFFGIMVDSFVIYTSGSKLKRKQNSMTQVSGDHLQQHQLAPLFTCTYAHEYRLLGASRSLTGKELDLPAFHCHSSKFSCHVQIRTQ